jgi:hypothetical protein
MWQQSLAHAASSLAAAATEAILGVPQPAPADPNQVVGILEMSNEIAMDFFGASQSLLDTGSDAFSFARACSSFLGELGVGIGTAAMRGAATGSARVGAGSGARNVGRISDPAYRPLASGQQSRAERLAAENATRVAREQALAGQQARRSNLQLVRPEGGGAGTRSTGKAAGGIGVGGG